MGRRRDHSYGGFKCRRSFCRRSYISRRFPHKFRYIKGCGKQGRPQPTRKIDSFDEFCAWFEENESNRKIYTVAELHRKLSEITNEVYCRRSFRDMLKSRYEKEWDFIVGSGTQSEMMTKRSTDDFKNMVYSNKEETIKLVAEIILKDIKSMDLPSDYPSPSELCEENDWAPQSLKTFMSYLITRSFKSTSLTKCIVQGVRP